MQLLDILMERNDFQYATKVWLTGVLLPSVLFILFGPTIGADSFAVPTGILLVFFSGLFSLPSWFLLYRAIERVNNLNKGMVKTKIALIFIAHLLTLMPFFLLELLWGVGTRYFFSSITDLLKDPVFLAYWLSICLGLIIFKLNPATPTEIENASNENTEVN